MLDRTAGYFDSISPLCSNFTKTHQENGIVQKKKPWVCQSLHPLSFSPDTLMMTLKYNHFID